MPVYCSTSGSSTEDLVIEFFSDTLGTKNENLTQSERCL